MFRTSLEALRHVGESFCVYFGRGKMYRVYLDDGTWFMCSMVSMSFLGSRETMCRFLLNHNVRLIFQDDTVLWSAMDSKLSLVQDAWRKYRVRTARVRNDVVLKGLAEYFGHPSRQDFSIPV